MAKKKVDSVEEEVVDKDYLYLLVSERDAAQRTRIRFGNRVSAIERGDDQVGEVYEAFLQEQAEFWEAREKDLTKRVVDQADGLEIVQLMAAVKGVGLFSAAQFVSMVDITIPQTVSALWRYAGFGVTDGKADRPTKGEKLRYNSRLKQATYNISQSMMRTGSPYRKVYDEAREHYDANRPDWTKGHKHNAALRKMVKVWLHHTWLVWRTLEGLSTRPLYVQEKLGHTSIYTPDEFGWEWPIK